jgi:hypothetical protein
MRFSNTGRPDARDRERRAGSKSNESTAANVVNRTDCDDSQRKKLISLSFRARVVGGISTNVNLFAFRATGVLMKVHRVARVFCELGADKKIKPD